MSLHRELKCPAAVSWSALLCVVLAGSAGAAEPAPTVTPPAQPVTAVPGPAAPPVSSGLTPALPAMDPVRVRILTIDQAVQEALRQNPTLEQATAAITGLQESWAKPAPSSFRT